MVYDDLSKEGKVLSNVIQDITNYRYKYIIEHMAFDSQKISVFQDYYPYLKVNSDYKPLDAKYKYKPDYLSYDEYGTYKFWELILFMNDCYVSEDFDMQYVYVPKYEAIYELMKNVIPESKRIIYLDKLILD